MDDDDAAYTTMIERGRRLADDEVIRVRGLADEEAFLRTNAGSPRNADKAARRIKNESRRR